MFESANLRHRVEKAAYKREAVKLRQALLDAQYALKDKGRFPVLILIAGVEGAGKSEIGDIQRFEKMLSDEGVLLLKYWFHLSRRQQKKRMKELAADPKTRWRVTEGDWQYFKLYKRFVKVCDPFLRKTSTGEAPWIVVPGADARFRTLSVARHLLAAMRERLAEKPLKRLTDKTPPLPVRADHLNVLRALELDQPMTRE